jgi:hypothetical protein
MTTQEFQPEASFTGSDSIHAADEPIYSDAERNAMRAFLQRSEVRMSTLHRIATAFISGAGLLLLIPVFFRDVVTGILDVLLAQMGNLFPALGPVGGLAASGALYILLLYPLLLSLAIPLYGVYLLLKDVVHFYFTIYAPGFPSDLLNPTFATTGLTFPPDESPRAKAEIMRFQYQPHQLDYMLPFSEGRRELYFDQMIKHTDGQIIPSSRQLDALRESGCLPDGCDEKEVRRFNAAFGIARSIDRTLVQEVAITEMMLTRSILYLRRLVLRYVKTLLMFIWTTLISFLMLPLLDGDQKTRLLVLALGYTIWSLAVLRIIRLPIGWIYRHRYGSLDPNHVDAQLTLMERRIAPFCRWSAAASLGAVVLALVLVASGGY